MNPVCRILRWEGEPPQTLKGFGMERLLRGAAALRDRVKAIRAQAAASPAPRQALSLSKDTSHDGDIRPHLTIPAQRM